MPEGRTAKGAACPLAASRDANAGPAAKGPRPPDGGQPPGRSTAREAGFAAALAWSCAPGSPDGPRIVQGMVDEILRCAAPGSPEAAEGVFEFLLGRIARAPDHEMKVAALLPRNGGRPPEEELRRLLPGFDLVRFLKERRGVFVLFRRMAHGGSFSGRLVALRCERVLDSVRDTFHSFTLLPAHLAQPAPPRSLLGVIEANVREASPDESDLRSFSLPLPAQLGLPPLEVRLSTPGSLAEDLVWLQESFALGLGEGAGAPLGGWGTGSVADLGLRPGALLGVDVESDAHLVQLSTGHRACLFRLAPCCEEPAALAALAALMADPAVGKVGVELLLDEKAILAQSDGAIAIQGGFDISPALLRENGTKLGLAGGFNSIFGTALVKDKRFTFSNWNCEVFTREQLTYAAFDAFLVRKMLCRFRILLKLPNVLISAVSTTLRS